MRSRNGPMKHHYTHTCFVKAVYLVQIILDFFTVCSSVFTWWKERINSFFAASFRTAFYYNCCCIFQIVYIKGSSFINKAGNDFYTFYY